MEKGLSKYWTPQAEEHYKTLLDACDDFAIRHLFMTIRDLLKYDGRSKEGKRAIAQARLRIATATDEELYKLALAEELYAMAHHLPPPQGRLEELKELRDKIREKGIKGGELECQKKPN